MADLTSATAGSVAAGVGAVTMALFNLPPGLLFAGFIGAGLGVTIAETPGRWATAWAFLFSMFGGAYAGGLLGPKLGDGVIAMNLTALVLATVALKAQTIFAGMLAPLIKSLLARIGVKQ